MFKQSSTVKHLCTIIIFAAFVAIFMSGMTRLLTDKWANISSFQMTTFQTFAKLLPKKLYNKMILPTLNIASKEFLDSIPSKIEHQKITKQYPGNKIPKKVKDINYKSSATDVYYNIIRPLHKRWDAFIRGKGINHGEGHSGQAMMYAQSIYFIGAVQEILRTKDYVQICEIGFNIGHSAMTWLAADYPLNRTRYLGFSMNLVDHQMCAKEIRNYLKLYLRQSLLHSDLKSVFHVIWGNSMEMVPKYTLYKNYTEKCDIIFVDGGHSGKVPLTDLQNMKKLANDTKNFVFMDDTCNAYFAAKNAWEKMEKEKKVIQYRCYTSEPTRRFCFGKYTHEGK